MMECDVPDLDKMRLFVYRRPLHPELFTIFLEKRIEMEGYQAQLWLMWSGHLVSFYRQDHSISELLTCQRELLPEKGLLEELELGRAVDYQVCYENRIYYMVNSQAEHMSEAVFTSVYDDMKKFARNRGLFMEYEHWAAEGHLAPFGFIDYERRASELDVFAYHAFPDRRVMLRTQSVFSLEPICEGYRPIADGPRGGAKP